MDEPTGPPKTPRWVKAIGILAGIVLLLAIVALAFGGGEHGPGRHMSGSDGSSHGNDHTPPAGNSTTHHTMAAFAPIRVPAT